MGNKRHREFWRGANEQHSVIADLQLRWPVAFPKDPGAVRPLAGTIAIIIAAELGWNLNYTRGVLCAWKQRRAYCNAVLRYDLRRDLDGAPTGDVGPSARTMAQEQLAVIDARKRKRAEQAASAAPAEEPPAPADLTSGATSLARAKARCRRLPTTIARR